MIESEMMQQVKNAHKNDITHWKQSSSTLGRVCSPGDEDGFNNFDSSLDSLEQRRTLLNVGLG
jgi:hypothetical protein